MAFTLLVVPLICMAAVVQVPTYELILGSFRALRAFWS